MQIKNFSKRNICGELRISKYMEQKQQFSSAENMKTRILIHWKYAHVKMCTAHASECECTCRCECRDVCPYEYACANMYMNLNANANENENVHVQIE
jgi:hypothetical protein